MAAGAKRTNGGGDQAGEPVDLSAILAASGPRRTAVLDSAMISPSSFGIGELLDLSRVLEIDPDGIGAMLRSGTVLEKGRIAVGLAWLIARRVEPGLTYEDVSRWSIEVRGKPPDPTPRRRAPRKPAPRSSRASGA